MSENKTELPKAFDPNGVEDKWYATWSDQNYFKPVDHKNGNHLNNNPKNLQTLCGNCHSIKTFLNKDWATAGRKSR